MDPFNAPSVTLACLGDHLRMSVLGYERPAADDRWDGNWLRTTVDLKVGSFKGIVAASLRADEFATFRERLAQLNQDPLTPGVAEFNSMEHWVTVTVTLTSGGALEVIGEAMDRADDGNRLRFQISGLDQTYLSTWLRELDAVLEAFPVRGM